MRIPPEKIEDVRQATDIVDLISGFVKLKKRGKNYLGLCPFHTEKTPSFSVSAEKQMYHCFGCGVGGNVFTFLMEMEKISFVESVRALADKAGISLPAATPDQEQAISEQEQIYEICRDAGLFFHKALTETQEGKLAHEYFHHRGFSDETIRIFGLGYSPNSWDAYLSHASLMKIPPDQIIKAGLARQREDGSIYDYFRGRAMFPVFAPTGRVVGFGARKIYEDDPIAGKYINSPETLVYEKSKILYGLYQAKDAVREQDCAILVEGYADLISLFQNGIHNVVASSGTALTREQIQLIKRYTQKIMIVYDADSAGSKAALRGVDLILESGMDVMVARLPHGDDPDSFVRKTGEEGVRKLLAAAVSFIDFIAVTCEEEGKLVTPEGQAETVRTIVHSIAMMSDELKRNFYIKRVAEKYKIYESALYRELEKQLGLNRYEMRREPAGTMSAKGREPLVNAPATKVENVPPSERDLIYAMLEGGSETIRYIFENVTLQDFTHPYAARVAELILQRTEEGIITDPPHLIDEIGDESTRRFLTEIVFSRYSLSKSWEDQGLDISEADPRKIAEGAIRALFRRKLEKMIEENRRILRDATLRGENADRYLQQHQAYLQQLKDLQ